MIKLLILIILFAILIWYLTGFSKKRAIKPKRNRWHAWGPFDQVWGFIDGDKPSLLPKSMPWPFNKVYFTLTYTQFVEDGKIEARDNEKSADGKTIYYRTAQVILGVKKPVRVVTEEVTRIRKTEIHPYVIKVTLPKTGGTFYLVFTVKIKMVNPMKTLRLEEFLVFVGNQLNDVVYPWAVEWEKTTESRHLKLNRELSKEELANLIIEDLIGLNIDKDDCILLKIEGMEVNLKTYMNKSVVKEFGGIIPDFSLDVGYDEKIKNILDLRNKQASEEENRKNEEKLSLTENVKRARTKLDQLQVIELKKKELVDVTIPELNAQSEAQAKANRAWRVGTLVLGENNASMILPTTKTKGGTHATV